MEGDNQVVDRKVSEAVENNVRGQLGTLMFQNIVLSARVIVLEQELATLKSAKPMKKETAA